MDKISKERRSANMQKIRSKNTKPELLVRKLVRAEGFSGYRTHRKDIPGKPDIAWLGRKIAIYVNGCFWHGHTCKEGKRIPKTRTDYWVEKITRNKARDKKQRTILAAQKWEILVIWECDLRDEAALALRIKSFLSAAFALTGEHRSINNDL